MKIAPTFFMQMYPDMASGDLTRRLYYRHSLVVLSMPLLLFLIPAASEWSGIKPFPTLLVLSTHLIAYGIGVFTKAYERYPTTYSTFVSTVNAAVSAGICALPGKFVAPIWVLMFPYVFVAARAAPFSVLLAIEFVALPLVVGVMWNALGSPFSESFAPLAGVSVFAGILYAFACLSSSGHREGMLNSAEARRLAAAEQERQRIAGELHDTIGAALAEIAMWQSVGLQRSDEEGRRAFERVDSRARAASVELRSLVRGLKAGVMGSTEARALLESRVAGLCEAASASLTIVAVGDGDFAVERVHHLAKIAEEAVNNAIRHGPPKSVRVDVDWAKPQLIIEDDGAGFDEASITPGHGLASMRTRATAIGASVTIDSLPGRGTRVLVSASQPLTTAA